LEKAPTDAWELRISELKARGAVAEDMTSLDRYRPHKPKCPSD